MITEIYLHCFLWCSLILFDTFLLVFRLCFKQNVDNLLRVGIVVALMIISKITVKAFSFPFNLVQAIIGRPLSLTKITISSFAIVQHSLWEILWKHSIVGDVFFIDWLDWWSTLPILVNTFLKIFLIFPTSANWSPNVFPIFCREMKLKLCW